MIEMKCPHCGHQLRISDKYAGQQGRCKTCRGKFAVQGEEEALVQGEEEALAAPIPDAGPAPISDPVSPPVPREPSGQQSPKRLAALLAAGGGIAAIAVICVAVLSMWDSIGPALGFGANIRITVTPEELILELPADMDRYLSVKSTSADDRSFFWQSSDKDVLKIMGDGVLWPLAPGTSTVRVEGARSGAVGEATVIVREAVAPEPTQSLVITGPGDHVWLESPPLPPVEVGEVAVFAGIEFVRMTPGTFLMGSAPGEVGRGRNEGPQQKVTISRGFWLGRFEVTKGQWETLMGPGEWKKNYGESFDPNSAATRISSHDAQAFAAALNELGEGVFRLPTEGEWEYACRAGSTTAFTYGNDPENRSLGGYAWFKGNTQAMDERYAHVVGQLFPNSWGFYDMHGNVWEWCMQWPGQRRDSGSPPLNPQAAPEGAKFARRGGGFAYEGSDCRCASVGFANPADRSGHFGFRIARELE